MNTRNRIRAGRLIALVMLLTASAAAPRNSHPTGPNVVPAASASELPDGFPADRNDTHPVVAGDPTIKFTKVPPKGGGDNRMETIAGVVGGINRKECNCRIVLYAHTDRFYVQPFIDSPYTELAGPDNSFETEIHLGDRYYALLVKRSFQATGTVSALPSVDGEVLAIASVKAAEPEKKAQPPQ